MHISYQRKGFTVLTVTFSNCLHCLFVQLMKCIQNEHITLKHLLELVKQKFKQSGAKLGQALLKFKLSLRANDFCDEPCHEISSLLSNCNILMKYISIANTFLFVNNSW